ncbi:Alcohol dehydrogenase OS=Rhodanobacter lindaniclasticus OX=75310 GN=B1991_00035 PE=4 SV=1 [Rhodanobacter lindaniclasticus]
MFPALAGNPVLQTADATSLINLVLQGDTLVATRTAPSTFTMPGFAWRLSDREVADVVTFIRGSWGNQAAPVSAHDVAKLRTDAMKAAYQDNHHR